MLFAVRIDAAGICWRLEQEIHAGLAIGSRAMSVVGSKKFGSTCGNIGGDDKSRFVVARPMFISHELGSKADGEVMVEKSRDESCSLDNWCQPSGPSLATKAFPMSKHISSKSRLESSMLVS